MKIIYWDIDGTLLNTGSAGLYAMTEVFQQLHGKDTPMPMIAAGGRTDNYICQQLLYKAHGVMPTDTEVQEFCRHYEATLLKWLRKKGKNGGVFSQVRPLLSYLDGLKNVTQLLLTGNSEEGARLKLEFFALAPYFDFSVSGFACNFYYRDDLARNAYKIAKNTWGSEIEEIVVIGDTPYDIQCGKAIGAKTVSVATGHYSYEALKACNPWIVTEVLPSPKDFAALLKLL